MNKVRVRFAPSPTGFLHVGNARTALFNWLFARQKQGVFVLRIEDTDIQRSAVKYEERLMEDLLWLGLNWDEGPDVGGEFGPYRQSLRLKAYQNITQKLIDGGRAYYCLCSPEDLETERKKAVSTDGTVVYSGKCRAVSREKAQERVRAGEAAAVRLLTPDQGELSFQDIVRGTLSFDLGLIGDPVIVRSNGLPAYNFAVVVDDVLMKITHVIRGEDHISNTPRQILIYKALSKSPPHFAHLSMVMGEDNTRLSKRHGATSVGQFQKTGILSTALFNYLSLLGWAPPDDREVLSKRELVDLFRLDKVSRSASIFDYNKLYWINRKHTKTLPPRQRSETAYPFLKKTGVLPEKMTEELWEWLDRALEALAERVDKFSDLPGHMDVFFRFSPQGLDQGILEALSTDCAQKVIEFFDKEISRVKNFDYDRFITITQQIKQITGCKGRNLYFPLRIVLTAQESGLDLDKLIPLIEEGARLGFPKPIKNCAQRSSGMIEFLEDSVFSKKEKQA